ncbi:MAG TPA: hypothetical protein V6C81_13725 [Planktothrix sp.]|jgi:thioredoxin-like negative regulator of GroEL
MPNFDDYETTNLALSGSRMSDEKTHELEARVADNPDDIKARIMLLGSYSRMQFQPGEPKQLRLKHIEWFIEHHPEHAIIGMPFADVEPTQNKDDYPRIRAAWMRKIEMNQSNVDVLANAASFFFSSEKELAEQLLLKSLALKPNDSDLRQQLALLYSLWDGHEEAAVEEQEKLLDASDSEELFYQLTDFPSMALAAGQLEKAVDGANRLLALAQQYQNDWNYGNAINEAHTVLGRVFLKNGDVQMAKFHLNQSSIDIATPQTTSFGPSLELAEELAKVGETACVLEYLDKFELLCGLDNQPAFDLRFAIKNGQQRDHANVSELERYEVALHEHQLSTLRARDPVKRAKHLAELLEKTRSRVQTWSVRLERAKLEENAQSIDSAEQMLKREQEHLLNLEALSAD